MRNRRLVRRSIRAKFILTASVALGLAEALGHIRFGLAVTILLLLDWLVRRLVCTRLSDLQRATKEVAAGRFPVVAPGAPDEIGALVKAFNDYERKNEAAWRR